jgi:hypothetical protein
MTIETCLFEGSGQVQVLSVKELYQGILHHLKAICVPNDSTDCIMEIHKSKESIRHIKRNWFELQRRNIISFPLYYGPRGNVRVAEYPEYLEEQLQCVKCLSPILLNTTFYIQVENYIKLGTQECGYCTKHPHNQRMDMATQSNTGRLLLNTLRIIGQIAEDKLSKLIRLEREMAMV